MVESSEKQSGVSMGAIAIIGVIVVVTLVLVAVVFTLGFGGSDAGVSGLYVSDSDSDVYIAFSRSGNSLIKYDNITGKLIMHDGVTGNYTVNGNQLILETEVTVSNGTEVEAEIMCGGLVWSLCRLIEVDVATGKTVPVEAGEAVEVGLKAAIYAVCGTVSDDKKEIMFDGLTFIKSDL